MTAIRLESKNIVEDIRVEIATGVADLHRERGVRPGLATVLVGDNDASKTYIKNKRKACENVGITSFAHELPAATTQAELLTLLANLNSDASVHGILVQLPLPSHISEPVIVDAVAPLKDVDGFGTENLGLLTAGRPRYIACTPHGIQQLLLRHGIPVAGKHVVIVGRSNIVGKPLALLLLQKGAGADATVTVCHSQTHNLTEMTRQADLIVMAIGRAHLLTGDMVKPGAVVVDVGTNRVNGKLVGDVDYEGVRQVALAITPVPGGVGPMTITMLLYNTLLAARLQSV